MFSVEKKQMDRTFFTKIVYKIFKKIQIFGKSTDIIRSNKLE